MTTFRSLCVIPVLGLVAGCGGGDASTVTSEVDAQRIIYNVEELDWLASEAGTTPGEPSTIACPLGGSLTAKLSIGVGLTSSSVGEKLSLKDCNINGIAYSGSLAIKTKVNLGGIANTISGKLKMTGELTGVCSMNAKMDLNTTSGSFEAAGTACGFEASLFDWNSLGE